MAESTPILITGATGLVGSALVQRLHQLDPNRSIRVMTRHPQGLNSIAGIPIEAHGWHADGGEVALEAIQGVGHIVHLAGETVAQRWTPEVRRRIRSSRIHTLDSLGKACQRHGIAPRLVSASAVGFYPDGDEVRKETDGPGEGFLADVVQEWESSAIRFGDLGGGEVRLRIGLVLSPEGGLLKSLVPLYRWGLGAPLAGGRQWQSWIAIGDLVDLFITAMEDSTWSGPLNATAPNPVTQSEFSAALARALGRPHFLPHVPSWVLRLRFGAASNALLASHRVMPERASAQAFQFRHARLEDALKHLLHP